MMKDGRGSANFEKVRELLRAVLVAGIVTILMRNYFLQPVAAALAKATQPKVVQSSR